MHGETKSLDGIGGGLFRFCLYKYFGQELFAVGAIELDFQKRVFSLKALDNSVGFFEIHRGIEDHLALFFRPFNQLLFVCSRGSSRESKNVDQVSKERSR